MLAIMAASCNNGPTGDFQFDLLTTNDVHGSWFDSTYTGKQIKPSLMAISSYVNEFRDSLGAENVILIDAGDCLQGDNAAYYFNYVDTVAPHLFPRLTSYMKYDAICVGNHDIETGHNVYDRVTKELKENGIPFLAGNAFKSDARTYFEGVKILKRNGVKIAVLGYTNPNMAAWLDESLWTGIEFKSLIPLVQQDVDKIISEEHPQAVIVAVHSGTGPGDGSVYESQGLDLLKTLKGVDFLICSHDHRAIVIQQDSICLINSGSHARNIGHGRLNLTLENGSVVKKSVSAELIPVDPTRIDKKMEEMFRPEFLEVKAFTRQKVGTLDCDLVTRESFRGMCPYMNLIHTLSLSCGDADVAFAAPLTFNRTIPSGTLIYNDLFTIYPYENQLFVIRMTGKQIKNYLEYSYDNWIQTYDGKGHALRIEAGDDLRNSQKRWHFVNMSFNFDSASGLDYTVDVTKPYGERVNISGMADGSSFNPEKQYNVAMTSYRASGGGNLLEKGAGMSSEEAKANTVSRHPELRQLLYNYLKTNGCIDKEAISNPKVIGSWSFIPEKGEKAIDKDMELLFGK